MYQIHPSDELVELFSKTPYQGVAPRDAEFLFIGLDANYAPNIVDQAIFPEILEYHADAVGYWQRHGVHHPFLRPTYKGDGLKYHRNFAKVGFGPEDAGRVSFVELMHLPTVGRSKLHKDDLDLSHLRFIRDAMFDGWRKNVFLPNTVLMMMRRFKDLFPELRVDVPRADGLQVIHRDANVSIYKHLHFSNYGKFEERLRREAEEIRGLLAE